MGPHENQPGQWFGPYRIQMFGFRIVSIGKVVSKWMKSLYKDPDVVTLDSKRI